MLVPIHDCWGGEGIQLCLCRSVCRVVCLPLAERAHGTVQASMSQGLGSKVARGIASLRDLYVLPLHHCLERFSASG